MFPYSVIFQSIVHSHLLLVSAAVRHRTEHEAVDETIFFAFTFSTDRAPETPIAEAGTGSLG